MYKVQTTNLKEILGHCGSIPKSIHKKHISNTYQKICKRRVLHIQGNLHTKPFIHSRQQKKLKAQIGSSKVCQESKVNLELQVGNIIDKEIPTYIQGHQP